MFPQTLTLSELPSLRSTRDKLESGRALRQILPRRELATLSSYDRDPLGILNYQNAARVQELLPLRSERMAQSPFAFFRGTAAIMAADLAEDEHTGVFVGACGDAHVANFGFYASPQRTLVFDLNDFDEAAYAPWEWDLKRLMASIVVSGQASSRTQRAIESAVLASVKAYADALKTAVERDPVQRFYTYFEADKRRAGFSKRGAKVLKAAIEDARQHTSRRATRKLTVRSDDGSLTFAESPPAMVHIERDEKWDPLRHAEMYLRSAGPDISQLLLQYRVTDIVRRAVGVGSVGTRCSLILLQDGDENTLILQSKEAKKSVLEQFGGIEQPEVVRNVIDSFGEGARVVGMQKILQGVSDPFLGHLQIGGTDLYIRQFHDMKGGIDTEVLEDQVFRNYAKTCAIVLARAHAQSPQAAVIAGYVGGGKALGSSMLEWGYAYAARSLEDYNAFLTDRELRQQLQETPAELAT